MSRRWQFHRKSGPWRLYQSISWKRPAAASASRRPLTIRWDIYQLVPACAILCHFVPSRPSGAHEAQSVGTPITSQDVPFCVISSHHGVREAPGGAFHAASETYREKATACFPHRPPTELLVLVQRASARGLAKHLSKGYCEVGNPFPLVCPRAAIRATASQHLRLTVVLRACVAPASCQCSSVSSGHPCPSPPANACEKDRKNVDCQHPCQQ